MKTNILILLLGMVTSMSWAQNDITICHTPATEKFALFASNKSFNNEHQMPRAYVHVSEAGGEMITFACADGMKANAYVIMAEKKTNNWIFVFQEW
ncbi:MAG TPA: dienelactone hydrolase, partial [Cytophagales bacterium]|nr:dienelactone hydrolase [Cytophagales bacterium]